MRMDILAYAYLHVIINRFLVSQLPQIPMLLICVHDDNASDELIIEGEKLAKNKEYVLFLNTTDYWQGERVTVQLEYVNTSLDHIPYSSK